MKNVVAKNNMLLGIFCLLLGAVSGAVMWLFLKAVRICTDGLWEALPSKLDVLWFPVLLCGVGGLVMGIIRKKYGDYPEDLDTVFSKYKQDKNYDYKKMPLYMVTAFLPLILGSSVGPEAGLTGMIVGLCCWAGTNIKAARQDVQSYTDIGIAVSLGVLFHSPLFGIFSVEEGKEEGIADTLKKPEKILFYSLSVAGAMLIYTLCSSWFGSAMNFPYFGHTEITGKDFLMGIVYFFCGILLIKVNQFSTLLSKKGAALFPPVVCEMVIGLCLGIVAVFAPELLFSGEEQMTLLMTNYDRFLPLALIAVALVKVLLTNGCIAFGLKGGQFFPLIFAGTSMGYGVAMLTLGGSHAVFAAAIVTAAMLGGILHKPIAVAVLLLLCFPPQYIFWIFLAAVLADKLMGGRKNTSAAPEEKEPEA